MQYWYTNPKNGVIGIFLLGQQNLETVHRNEVSGALTGLFRVRQITQDDSHTFAREDQIEDEISILLKMATDVYSVFGFKFVANLSTMPDSHLGDEAYGTRQQII